MTYKIVADSSCNIISTTAYPFESVPMHILVGDKEYIDDANMDMADMYATLNGYKGKTSTACPGPDAWIQAFGDAEVVYCLTITSNLSGAHNSALIAKEMYESDHPDRKVYVIDSLSTGPAMVLLMDRIHEMASQGMEPEAVVKAIEERVKTTHLFFALESIMNLANNGRVSPIVAKGIGILGVQILGVASEVGTVQPIDKARGCKGIIKAIIKHLKKFGYTNGKLVLSHGDNPEGAAMLKEAIEKEFGEFNGVIMPNTALCGYYAEHGDLMLGFEV